MKTLFDPAQLGKLKCRNRIIHSATWLGMTSAAGIMPEELYQAYDRLAQGGVGAIITESTTVAREDFADGGVARLSDDTLIPAHRKLTDLVHEQNCPIIAQLVLGDYAGGIRNNGGIDGLSADDIENAIRLFGGAALRAEKAGYDGVQIHAAHGFFLSRFISPAHNHRTDAWGMCSRCKILLDILHEVRERAPGLHVSMKINCSDFMPGGLTEKESLDICIQCAEAGFDSIEVSGNGTSVAGIRPGINEGYFARFALNLADQVHIPVIVVGGFRSKEYMEKILNAGRIEFLAMSRPLIREPDLPLQWQDGRKAPSACVSCNRCYQTPGHQCFF